MKLKNFLEHYGLRLTLIMFVIVGLTGIFYDYSLNTGGDETILMAATIKMISEKTLRPAYPTFYHLPVGAYIYLPFFILFFIALRLLGVFTSLDGLKEFGIIDYQKFLPFARFLSVLMGAACVYLIYKITEKLFNNRWISLLASFFLAFNLMFVQVAHLGRVWLPQVMTILLAFYLVVILFKRQEENVKDYLLAGLGIGLAFGTHVVGIAVYAPFLAAHYLKSASKKFKDIFLTNKYFWLANLMVLLCYLLFFYLNPYGYANYINKQGKIYPNISYLNQQAFSHDTSAAGTLKDVYYKIAYYPNALFQHDPLLCLLSLLGFIYLFFKERKIFYLIFSFILIYYPVISFAGWEPRWILPVVPMLAIAAGFGARELYEKFHKKLAISALALVMAIIFIMPIIWDYRIIQPSNRLEARNWLYKNIPAGASLVNFDPLLDINDNRQSLLDIKKYAANYFSKKRAYLLEKSELEYPKPNYYVLNYSYFENLPKELSDKKYDYLIIGWGNWVELEEKLVWAKIFKSTPTLIKRFPEAAREDGNYVDWWDMAKPIQTILRDNIKAPVIDIYKLTAN